MATLSAAERATGHAEWMRNPLPNEDFPTLKAELRAAYDAVDQWISNNAAAYNAALPQPFRGAATAKAKAFLLARVLQDRFNFGSY